MLPSTAIAGFITRGGRAVARGGGRAVARGGGRAVARGGSRSIVRGAWELGCFWSSILVVAVQVVVIVIVLIPNYISIEKRGIIAE